jgi:hypothetical protein
MGLERRGVKGDGVGAVGRGGEGRGGVASGSQLPRFTFHVFSFPFRRFFRYSKTAKPDPPGEDIGARLGVSKRVEDGSRSLALWAWGRVA